MSNEPNVLEIRDLVISYRARGADSPVVHGLSLAIARGETLALVGESGSGKTTTAQAVMGLLPATGRVLSGEILLDGTDITRWSSRRLTTIRGSRIALVPQDPATSLNPSRTIGSQVAEIFHVHGRGDRESIRRNVLELLSRVGLSNPELRARQYPHELSGGMKQRVLIATALALKPDLIIADEPTSALDVTVQKQILNLLDGLKREQGSALLLVTHDLGVAAERSDRIVVMRNGRIEESGVTRAVVHQPASDYARRLLRDAVDPLGDGGSVEERLPEPILPQPPVIDVKSVTKVFGSGRDSVTAVDGATFAVAPGSIHALVGESGSGKTTTVRMVMGLTVPTEGEILVGGLMAGGRDRAQRRLFRQKIQIVYQNPYNSLDPRLSVDEIVQEPMRNFGLGGRRQRRARAADLLDLVALPQDSLHRRPRELSGGQRQRVAIARALAARPEILVLDEAVSALDVTVRAQILRLLVDLRAELGLTYLFITHDMGLVRSVSDWVTVMNRGRVVESGPTSTVFANPAEEYTRELLTAIPSLRPTPHI